jgi:hypothetical protein
MDVRPGQSIVLKNGTRVEVLENIGDGSWLKGKFDNGEEELVFCEDIAKLDDSTSG